MVHIVWFNMLILKMGKGKTMRTLMFGIIMYSLMYIFAMLPMVVIVILTWIVYGIGITLKYLGVM